MIVYLNMSFRTLTIMRPKNLNLYHFHLSVSCMPLSVYTNSTFRKKLNYFNIPAKRTSSNALPLTKSAAQALILKLTDDERNILVSSLKEFESERMKADYRDKLAAFRWRSKFGRPSKVPNLGDVDPTGSYCPVPEDWLYRKYAETASKPTSSQLFGVAVHNAVPFVGFGFLDNFVMIVCGDYIEIKLGSLMVLSTMAAAALGNTFSDLLGIGSAYYVEQAAAKFGVKPPPLSPVQLAMSTCRIASNLGRVIGVTVGCILGMVPLLFINNKEDLSKVEKLKNEIK